MIFRDFTLNRNSAIIFTILSDRFRLSDFTKVSTSKLRALYNFTYILYISLSPSISAQITSRNCPFIIQSRSLKSSFTASKPQSPGRIHTKEPMIREPFNHWTLGSISCLIWVGVPPKCALQNLIRCSNEEKLNSSAMLLKGISDCSNFPFT